MALMHKSNAPGHTDHYPPPPAPSHQARRRCSDIHTIYTRTAWFDELTVWTNGGGGCCKINDSRPIRSPHFSLSVYINLWGTRDAIIKNQTFCSPPWPFSLAFLFSFSTPDALSTRDSTHKRRITTTATAAVIYIISTRAVALRVCMWVGGCEYIPAVIQTRVSHVRCVRYCYIHTTRAFCV